jgi:hypothetical protein
MLRAVIACLGLALLAGCASPAYRIKKNPEVFASFPPEVQENVRAGRIAVGYTTDMVLIALGRPSRVYHRQTAEGHTLIWSYAKRYHSSEWRPVETTRVRRDRRGRRILTSDIEWVDVGSYTEYEAMRVEIEDGKVKAIEVVSR